MRVWKIFFLAVKKFLQIDGAHWAGAFAFNAFFSLFPLIILLVSISSTFVDRDMAGEKIINYVQGYIPLDGEMQHYISDTIAGVIKARGQAGAVAFLLLVWVALQCFMTHIIATNRAWGITVSSWWRLPLKSLMLLGITGTAIFLGVAVPLLMKMAHDLMFRDNLILLWLYDLGSIFIPLLVVFFGLVLFYRFAPRRPTHFAEVWAAALCTTVLLRVGESLFVIFLKNFATFNAVYGAFGGIIAFLLWIYISGCIFIFGVCLCASQAEMHSFNKELSTL